MRAAREQANRDTELNRLKAQLKSLREMLRERFPWLPDAEPRPDGDASRDLPSEELRRLIRQAFRRELDTAGSAEVDLVSSQRLDAAFSALRELHTQMELLRCSSATASEAAAQGREMADFVSGHARIPAALNLEYERVLFPCLLVLAGSPMAATDYQRFKGRSEIGVGPFALLNIFSGACSFIAPALATAPA